VAEKFLFRPSSSKRELRLGFQFSSSDAMGVRLNTYLDSIGPVWSRSLKPSTPRGLPAPRSNAAARSRNTQQYTQRLSIQSEGGSRFAGPAEAGRTCESSFLWTCHWGGCSKIFRSFRGYVSSLDPNLSSEPMKRRKTTAASKIPPRHLPYNAFCLAARDRTTGFSKRQDRSFRTKETGDQVASPVSLARFL
jgi:hypothetical protein